MFLKHEDRFVSFHTYCLSGALLPRPVAFGTNSPAFDDGRFDTKPDQNALPVLSTFFEHDGSYFIVSVNASVARCGVSASASLKAENYTTHYRHTKKTLRAFGGVIHVLIELADHGGLGSILFPTEDEILGTVYKRLPRNEFLNRHLNAVGWCFDKLDHDHVYYRRSGRPGSS